MKPYWQNEEHDLTIYCGDCLEVLPALAEAGERFDLCLTDPPYGVDFRGEEWDAEIPNWWPLARACCEVVVFTTGQSTLWDYPPADWVLCGFRPGAVSHSGLGTGFSHWTPVLIYGNPHFPVDAIRIAACGQPPNFPHPSPKQLPLMKWLAENASPDGGTVLDPFLGSGTTLVACYRLGRHATGIEISEEYCELAARRLEAELAQGRLFEPAEVAQPTQEVMSI